MGLQPSSDLQYIEQQYNCLKPLSVVGLFVISGCNIAAIWDDLLGKLDSLSLQWNSTASGLYQYLKSKLSQYSSHVFTTSVFEVLIISNLVTL